MAGLVLAIHVWLASEVAQEGVDARHKAGHDAVDKNFGVDVTLTHPASS